MGRLSNGMARLAQRRLEIDGEAATYTDGVTTLNVTIIPGRTQQPTDTNEQTSVRQSDQDFLIAPTEIVFSGSQRDPRMGDRITWAGKVYEATPIIDGEQCWTPCDDWKHLIRIHTRRES